MQYKWQDAENNDTVYKLESLRWSNGVFCPYCKSKRCTHMTRDSRYHCNSCLTSFSVTVGTVFHDSKVPLCKWAVAINLTCKPKGNYVSCRTLAQAIDVNKNTANRMLNVIRTSWYDQEARQLMLAFANEITNER